MSVIQPRSDGSGTISDEFGDVVDLVDTSSLSGKGASELVAEDGSLSKKEDE